MSEGPEERVDPRMKIVERNIKLLHAKVDDMDQINSVVNVPPLDRHYMPQMANKKRYNTVQKMVSPNPNKGQKTFHLFKGEDNFIRETLNER